MPLGLRSRQRFVRLLVRALRSAGFGEPIEFDEDRFRLLLGRPAAGRTDAEGDPEEGRAVIDLERLHAEWASIPFPRGRGLIRQIAVSLAPGIGTSIPESFEQAQRGLRLMVRDRWHWDLVRLQAEAGGQRVPNVPRAPIAGGELTVEVAYDTPGAIAGVTEEQLADWGSSFERAVEIGRRNLRSASPPSWRSRASGLHVGTWSDGYDGSRIVLTDVLLALEVEGSPIAMAPARDLLLVTGSGSATGMEEMVRMADATLARATRPLSGQPFEITTDGPRPWSVPADHPQAGAFTRLALAARYEAAETQRTALERIHDQRDEDVHVAELMILDPSDDDAGRSTMAEFGGGPVAIATLVEGLGSWLPEADLVALQPANGALLGLVRWADLAAMRGGGILERIDVPGPPRWRATAFPDAGECSAVGIIAAPGGA